MASSRGRHGEPSHVPNTTLTIGQSTECPWRLGIVSWPRPAGSVHWERLRHPCGGGTSASKADARATNQRHIIEDRSANPSGILDLAHPRDHRDSGAPSVISPGCVRPWVTAVESDMGSARRACPGRAQVVSPAAEQVNRPQPAS